MFQARSEAGLSQMQVCEALGIAQGTLSEAERVAQGSSRTTEFAKLYKVSAHWLATGAGPRKVPHRIEEPRPTSGVAQPLSPSAYNMPPLVTWEDVVGEELPELFRCAMPDDALRNTTPKGTVLLCSTTEKPVFGKGVIVQDASGGRYVRRYAQGQGGQWVAEADAPGFATLRSADGIKVVAAVIGRFDGTV